MSELCGLVVAAGESTRMGGFPKPLLSVDSDRFVERILDTLAGAGVEKRVVVLGHEHEAVRDRADLSAARVVVNEAYEEGMLCSIQAGVEAISEAGGIYLWPVDYPFVTEAVVARLRDAFHTERADVILPTVAGESGHPTVFAASTFERLLSAPEDEGARAVVYAEDTDATTVPVDEKRVLVDIDRPEEYWEAVKRYG